MVPNHLGTFRCNLVVLCPQILERHKLINKRSEFPVVTSNIPTFFYVTCMFCPMLKRFLLCIVDVGRLQFYETVSLYRRLPQS